MLAEQIKRTRKAKGLSQNQLIAAIETEYGVHISKSMLSRYENSTNLPTMISISSLFALTAYLDLSLDEIARTEIKNLKQ